MGETEPQHFGLDATPFDGHSQKDRRRANHEAADDWRSEGDVRRRPQFDHAEYLLRKEGVIRRADAEQRRFDGECHQ